jgi:hypothetical protein
VFLLQEKRLNEFQAYTKERRDETWMPTNQSSLILEKSE